MAVQVSYPGVYIEEFAPGAPIQGVGTSTAAFIGTATSGPIEKPTLIQSWDAFKDTFGGFIAEQPSSYLAPAVYGFFLNGGTSCYVLRAGTGSMATANLDSRQGGGSPEPVLVVRALQEGPGGNAISVQVVESSRLSSLLNRAGSTDTDLALHRAEATVSNVSDDRMQLTVSSNDGFASGDRILLARITDTDTDTDTATVVVDSTQGRDTLVLAAPIPGNADFSGGTVRTADLVPGQSLLRLAVPAGLRLNQALPRGTNVSITLRSDTEIRTVESSGGDTITLTEGLTNTYSLEDAFNLPRVTSLEFNLVIINASNGTSETFEQLATHPQHPNYWGNIVVSGLVTLEEPATPPAPMPADPRPAVGTYNLENGTADDRAAARAQIIADPNRYLDLLKSYDEVALVCIPGFTDAAVQQAMIAHCETMQDRFAIGDRESVRYRPGLSPESL